MPHGRDSRGSAINRSRRRQHPSPLQLYIRTLNLFPFFFSFHPIQYQYSTNQIDHGVLYAMFIYYGSEGSGTGSSEFPSLIGRLATRVATVNTTSTASALTNQQSNPSDISTILIVIGGDVVQKALAQGTGKQYYTPVCFSFGQVSYAFTALIDVIGDGRLLPPPDYPVRVFNLESGYVRDNKNQVVGRLLRDLESFHEKEEPLGDYTLRILVYDILPNSNGPAEISLSGMHIVGLCSILLQFALAAILVALAREWDILFIIAAGTILAQIAGSLPQWRAEKLPNRQRKKELYALTQGNGSREIVVIRGKGNCLDLEELSASPSPRSGRLWEKFQRHNILSEPKKSLNGQSELSRSDTWLRKSRNARGFPLGFWIT